MKKSRWTPMLPGEIDTFEVSFLRELTSRNEDIAGQAIWTVTPAGVISIADSSRSTGGKTARVRVTAIAPGTAFVVCEVITTGSSHRLIENEVIIVSPFKSPSDG